MKKRDVKKEVLERLHNHPLYQQALSAVSGSQKIEIERRVVSFVEAFAVKTVEKLAEVNKEELKEALRKYKEEARTKVVSDINSKKS